MSLPSVFRTFLKENKLRAELDAVAEFTGGIDAFPAKRSFMWFMQRVAHVVDQCARAHSNRASRLISLGARERRNDRECTEKCAAGSAATRLVCRFPTDSNHIVRGYPVTTLKRVSEIALMESSELPNTVRAGKFGGHRGISAADAMIAAQNEAEAGLRQAAGTL